MRPEPISARSSSSASGSPRRVPDNVLVGYFPPEMRGRWMNAPRADRSWRIRVVLLLWSLGYQLDHASWLASGDDGATNRRYQESLALLGDERLLASFDSTAQQRGDGSRPFASVLWP
jgi:hypothetical protein